MNKPHCFWSRINHLGTGRPSSSATRLSEVTDNSSDQPYEIRLNVDAVRDAIEVDDSSIPLRGCGFWGLAPCGLLVGVDRVVVRVLLWGRLGAHWWGGASAAGPEGVGG